MTREELEEAMLARGEEINKLGQQLTWRGGRRWGNKSELGTFWGQNSVPNTENRVLTAIDKRRNP